MRWERCAKSLYGLAAQDVLERVGEAMEQVGGGHGVEHVE